MKFKVDENLPTEVADLLNAAGHDALTVETKALAEPTILTLRLCGSLPGSWSDRGEGRTTIEPKTVPKPSVNEARRIEKVRLSK